MKGHPAPQHLVDQIVSDAAFLACHRPRQLARPDADLDFIVSIDERLEALVDAARAAGMQAVSAADAALANDAGGEAFLPALLAFERRDTRRIESLLALAEAVPGRMADLASALMWVSARHLKGFVPLLLRHGTEAGRVLAVEACVRHRVSAEQVVAQVAADRTPASRTRALAAIGELGLPSLSPLCRPACADPEPRARFAAARSAFLLDPALDWAQDPLRAFCLADGAWRVPSMQLLLARLPTPHAHELLVRLRAAGASTQQLVDGAALCADAAYLPWLLSLLDSPEQAPAAARAIEQITGLRAPPGPEGFEALKSSCASRAFPTGTRLLLGKPCDAAVAEVALRDGFQHERLAAALYLYDRAGMPGLFPCDAPGWRQMRILATSPAPE
ncbi:MAG TPA: hypothetical protein VF169_28300 [Albitalea sp.]|uniref:hypothetical protein n=1 Tax=Piscinibacter sp. TaxID=1903157 RepID=UPI002ECFC1D2